MADISHWFVRRRGIAVAIAACGNYLAGVIWPPVVQHFIASNGWRATQIGVGVFLPRRHAAAGAAAAPRGAARTGDAWPARRRWASAAALGISPNALQVLLYVAGVACCVAMSMPQVHIVAYCGDLGYGAARGAEMLSLMLGFGIDQPGRLAASSPTASAACGTLLLGSVLQGVALFLYLFDGLFSLYVISALFGLFQGGIVPMYAIIVREYFPPQEAGTRSAWC